MAETALYELVGSLLHHAQSYLFATVLSHTGVLGRYLLGDVDADMQPVGLFL